MFRLGLEELGAVGSWGVGLPLVRDIEVQLDFVPVRIMHVQALRESAIRQVEKRDASCLQIGLCGTELLG